MLKKEASFKKVLLFSFAAVLLASVTTICAADLESYEPTTLGYTKDSDDVPFFDFKISVKYPIFPILFDKRLFFAFSGRFGQYIGTRSSSPVIGKRFNPKLCVMFPFDTTHPRRDYIDFAYAHESNGQKIDTLAESNEIQKDEEKPTYARDYISRGWDYLEIVAKNTYLITIYPMGYYRAILRNTVLGENDSEGKRVTSYGIAIEIGEF